MYVFHMINIIVPTSYFSFPLYRIMTVKCTTPLQGSLSIIGANLSEPHIDEFAVVSEPERANQI